MKILYRSNAGDGRTKEIQVDESDTFNDILSAQETASATQFTVRCNGTEVSDLDTTVLGFLGVDDASEIGVPLVAVIPNKYPGN